MFIAILFVFNKYTFLSEFFPSLKKLLLITKTYLSNTLFCKAYKKKTLGQV